MIGVGRKVMVRIRAGVGVRVCIKDGVRVRLKLGLGLGFGSREGPSLLRLHIIYYFRLYSIIIENHYFKSSAVRDGSSGVSDIWAFNSHCGCKSSVSLAVLFVYGVNDDSLFTPLNTENHIIIYLSCVLSPSTNANIQRSLACRLCFSLQ